MKPVDVESSSTVEVRLGRCKDLRPEPSDSHGIYFVQKADVLAEPNSDLPFRVLQDAESSLACEPGEAFAFSHCQRMAR